MQHAAHDASPARYHNVWISILPVEHAQVDIGSATLSVTSSSWIDLIPGAPAQALLAMCLPQSMLKHDCACRRGPGVHELRQMASLLKSLLERGWSLHSALHTSWTQVRPSITAPYVCFSAFAMLPPQCLLSMTAQTGTSVANVAGPCAVCVVYLVANWHS